MHPSVSRLITNRQRITDSSFVEDACQKVFKRSRHERRCCYHGLAGSGELLFIMLLGLIEGGGLDLTSVLLVLHFPPTH